MYRLKRIWTPEIYQGAGKNRNYFEGWYYKLISADRAAVMAVIPGVAFGRDPSETHAFVQAIDGRTGAVRYFRYDISEFTFSRDRFEIRIGRNYFTRDSLMLDLEDPEGRIGGALAFSEIIPFPKSFLKPGIMGPYSFVPRMECYHGVVNISHRISGSLEIDGRTIDFTNGEGYLEKDYGRSFPSTWIWIQASHFDDRRTCFQFSLARIPWLGRSFTGLIGFVMHDGNFYRFASYNGAKLIGSSLSDHRLTAELRRKDFVLSIRAEMPSGGILKAPKNGMMIREIEESIDATAGITLTRGSDVIFQGSSPHAGMEISEGAQILFKK